MSEAHRRAFIKRVHELGGPLNSPIERRMHEALQVRGIGFGAQVKLLGRYLVDILVNQAPVVIECDGFLHRLPAGKAKDQLRDAALIQAGFLVSRFTGSQINRDALGCVDQVIESFELIPDKEPRFDIPTSWSGPLHPRWVGREERLCETCGAILSVRPSTTTKFCNFECYWASMRGKPEYEGLTKARATPKYRDRQLAAARAWGAAHVGALNPNWVGREDRHCVKCGAGFSATPKSSQKFCSYGCYWESLRKNQSVT